MPRPIRKSSYTTHESYEGQHRFEHWYRDNTVYFITSRTRDGYAAFDTEEAKVIFWDRFTHWTSHYGFVPWVTTLLNNHYHTEGYLKVGNNLGPMMQRVHGSVAKLVNDLLPERRVPFWRERGTRDYFDGCIRNEVQCRRAYRYTLLQAVRAGFVRDYRDYPHTHVDIEWERAIGRALELKTFEGLESVPYPRYDRKRSGR
jgi:hypothetical protein